MKETKFQKSFERGSNLANLRALSNKIATFTESETYKKEQKS